MRVEISQDGITVDPIELQNSPEEDNSTIISGGLALSEDEQYQRRKIVTERYLEAGYITPDDPRMKNGVYYDDYEDISIPIIAKMGDEVVASVRLIPNSLLKGLPINTQEDIVIEDTWGAKISKIPFEISQLAKSNKQRRNPYPTLAVLRSYIAVSRMYGENDAAAVLDKGVFHLLNGRFMGFDMPYVGPPVTYMGSASLPVYVNIDNCIKNALKRNPYLSQFLDTGEAPGFEWYQGI